MPVFFIRSTQVEGEKIIITNPLFDHLYKSLRSKPGDPIKLNDEQGRRYHTSIIQITSQLIHVKILHIEEAPSSTIPRITLAQAILKGEKMNWVIQKTTELGIHAFAPLITERVIPRISSPNTPNSQQRWERISLEAAQQSERWTVPTIYPTQHYTEFLKGENYGLNILMVERREENSLVNIPLGENQDNITVLIGPEGGWSSNELRLAQSEGFSFASLGRGILRAETASLAAVTVLQSRLGYL